MQLLFGHAFVRQLCNITTANLHVDWAYIGFFSERALCSVCVHIIPNPSWTKNIIYSAVPAPLIRQGTTIS
jgi:hypothetical protein